GPPHRRSRPLPAGQGTPGRRDHHPRRRPPPDPGPEGQGRRRTDPQDPGRPVDPDPQEGTPMTTPDSRPDAPTAAQGVTPGPGAAPAPGPGGLPAPGDRPGLSLLVAAGGPGGHVFPGLALARTIVQHDPRATVRLAGAVAGHEHRAGAR